jgi:hypothetical protein
MFDSYMLIVRINSLRVAFMLVEPVEELKHTGFGRTLQTRVVYVLHSKPHTRTQRPLKVAIICVSNYSLLPSPSLYDLLKNRPSPRPRNINPIFMNS